MKREVKLAISGMHFDAGEENELETFVRAEYFCKNGSHYVIYEEKQEGFEESSRNRIKFKPGLVELTRQGILRTHMIFEENQKHMTEYVTPYGELLLGINTKSICMQEEENSILVTVEYSLEADGDFLSDCKIRILIKE
ncbi:MAG: DUF1934 domain-containing protein [Lachnospiraceae bacterium]|nr:DUF1934 domain-containing protein [Lachnospiraceae bacterium]